MKFDQFVIREVIKIIATRCHILRLKCTNFDSGWGSAPDPARLGELSAGTFSGNGNVVTLVAKATAPKPNRPQHLHVQTETGFRIESGTGLDKWNTALVFHHLPHNVRTRLHQLQR